jgi:membrane protein DedA with SNARE-associated domain
LSIGVVQARFWGEEDDLLAALEQYIIPFLMNLYGLLGYGGVFLAMAIESCCIPLPSEIVLPMAGWMVARGQFDLWLTVIAGTVGCTVGSVACYAIGAYGGRPLLQRYGKYVLISMDDLDTAERWFKKYGEAAVFFSRMLPVVRTFISLPAGITRMNFGKFVLYSTIGSFPWTLALVYVGKLLGDNWAEVRKTLSGLDYVIVAVIVAVIALYVYRHVRKSARAKDPGEIE